MPFLAAPLVKICKKVSNGDKLSDGSSWAQPFIHNSRDTPICWATTKKPTISVILIGLHNNCLHSRNFKRVYANNLGESSARLDSQGGKGKAMSYLRTRQATDMGAQIDGVQ